MTADDSAVRVEAAVLDQGGVCGFCRAWIAGDGLGDTGADGGAGVLLWDWEKTGKKTTGAAAVFGLR